MKKICFLVIVLSCGIAFAQNLQLIEERIERYEPPFDLSGSSVPSLIRSLSSIIAAERLSATYYLGRLTDQSDQQSAFLPLLETFLNDEVGDIQRFAGMALEKYDYTKLDKTKARELYGEALEARLSNPATENTLRSQTATILGLLRDKRSAPVLIDALKSDSVHVRVASAKSLAIIGDKRALSPLRALRDATPQTAPEYPLYDKAFKDLCDRIDKEIGAAMKVLKKKGK